MIRVKKVVNSSLEGGGEIKKGVHLKIAHEIFSFLFYLQCFPNVASGRGVRKNSAGDKPHKSLRGVWSEGVGVSFQRGVEGHEY